MNPDPTPRPPLWRIWGLRLVGLAAVIAVYFWVPPVRHEVDRLVFLLSMADVDAARGFVEAAGVWAPLVSLGLMIAQAVIAPLPAVMVTFANAALFGWVLGAALSWTGAMLGAAICFGLARWLGRALVERHAPGNLLARFDGAVERWGVKAVLVARLLPFVSFDAISYGAGVTRLKFWPFLLATGIGQLPATIVYSWAGDLLAVNRGLLWGAIAFTGAIALVIIPAQLWFKRRKPT